MIKFNIKLITTVALIFGLTLAVSAASVPDSATPLSVPYVLRFVTSQNPHERWYSVSKSPYLDDWQDGTVADTSPIIYPSVIFKGVHQVQDYHLRDTTTYYIQYELYSDVYVYGMTTNASFYKLVPEEHISAIFGQYDLETASQVHNPEEYDLPRISDVAREVTTEVTQVGGHTFRVSFAFSTKAGVEESEYQAIMFTSNGALEDGGNLMLKEFYAWTDENLSIYEDLVAGKLDDIQGSIDDLGNKIEEGNDQAHQDAEDIKDAIADLPEKEKEEAQSVGGGQFEAGQEALAGFDVSSLTGSIEALFQSMTYHGTDATFKLPTSGEVPFVGTVLWDEYTFSLLPAQIVEDPSFKVVQVIGKCMTTIGTAYVVLYVFNDLLTTFNGKKGGAE